VGWQPGHAQAGARAGAGRRAGRPGRRALAGQALAASAAGDLDGDGDPDGDDAAETALRLAGHLAELARLAAPDDDAIGEIHRRVFTARADAATSTMAKGVFRWAAQGGR
jgi:hypothetical protein